MKASERQNAGLAATMRDCARNVGLGLLAFAAFVGFVFVAPTVGNMIASAWYGRARILTSDYTSLTAAVWVEWLSLIAAVWAVCVTVKVTKVDEGASLWFAGLAAAVALIGALPSQCALYAMTGDWTRDSAHTLIEHVAQSTVLIVAVLSMLAPVMLLFLGN